MSPFASATVAASSASPRDVDMAHVVSPETSGKDQRARATKRTTDVFNSDLGVEELRTPGQRERHRLVGGSAAARLSGPTILVPFRPLLLPSAPRGAGQGGDVAIGRHPPRPRDTHASTSRPPASCSDSTVVHRVGDRSLLWASGPQFRCSGVANHAWAAPWERTDLAARRRPARHSAHRRCRIG